MDNIENFPIDVFPEIAKHAILEVWNQTNAPLPMIASTALATMATSVQAGYHIVSDDERPTPLQLFLMVLADSGERKSTVERMLTQGISKFDETQEALTAINAKNYAAERELWQLEKENLRNSLEHSRDHQNQRKRLRHLLENPPIEPQPIKVGGLQNSTAPAMMQRLSNYGRSAMYCEDEGSKICEDRLFSQQGPFNTGWDGSTLRADRKKEGASIVKSPRVTLYISIQPAVFDVFIKTKGALSFDNGFFSRTLICKPISTQGFRVHDSNHKSMAATHAFRDRTFDLLTEQSKTGAFHNHEIEVSLRFNDEADHQLTEIMNWIEINLRPGNWLSLHKGFASKYAENVSRIAGIFHAFSGEPGVLISAHQVQAAHAVAQYFLQAHVQTFPFKPNIPEHVSDAYLLEEFLLKQFKFHNTSAMDKNDLRQCCPNPLRKNGRFAKALTLLTSVNRVWIGFFPGSKKAIVNLNHQFFTPLCFGYMPANFPILENFQNT